MNALRRTTAGTAIALALVSLTACSKTVKWDEEVLLNTGETIWMKRSLRYSLQGDAGNPFDMKLRPENGSSTMQFQWTGNTYQYTGPSGFILLAISPTNKPVLVKPATAGAWDATTNYKCTVPFYAQFEPDATGKNWTWPSAIDSWLFNLPANIFVTVGDPEMMKTRITMKDKAEQPYLRDPQLKAAFMIDPTYTGDLCKNGGN